MEAPYANTHDNRFLTLFVSANCSLYEAVLYSTRIGTLEAAKRKKDEKAKLALQLVSFK